MKVPLNRTNKCKDDFDLIYRKYLAQSGFISGSTLLTLYVLFGVVPAHLFFLRFFEELELELRLGESYKEYKQKTPFLIPRLSAR